MRIHLLPMNELCSLSSLTEKLGVIVGENVGITVGLWVGYEIS
jgi:hypothetical protein